MLVCIFCDVNDNIVKCNRLKNNCVFVDIKKVCISWDKIFEKIIVIKIWWKF